MNAEQLNAIKERAAKATHGNWHATLDDPYDRTYVLGAFDGVVSVIADIKGDADAQFIAHAREDVPALVVEVERLRKELSFIAHVDLTTNAYDTKHLATSVQCWAMNVLDGINHDNTVADWYNTKVSK